MQIAHSICMKCQILFAEKKFANLSSAELAKRVVKRKSKRLPLETKNALQIENASLGFIETPLAVMKLATLLTPYSVYMTILRGGTISRPPVCLEICPPRPLNRFSDFVRDGCPVLS